MAKSIITCSSCGVQAELKAKGLCSACYQRLKPKPTEPRVRKPQACRKCGQVKPYKGRGLCITCHSNETAALRVTRPRLCQTCNTVQPAFTLTQCATCYERDRHARRYVPRMVHPTCCSECGGASERYVKGLCFRCYEVRRDRANGPIVTCTGCHEPRMHVAHGLCRACYTHALSPTPRREVACAECGVLRPHCAWGLCAPCYNQANRAVRRVWRRRRYTTDPEFRHRALQAIRRRKRALWALPGDHTHAEWEALLELHGHRCVYCSADIRGCATRDHIVPVTTAGSTDDIENIVPACMTCNARKGTRSAAEFIRTLFAEHKPRSDSSDG